MGVIRTNQAGNRYLEAVTSGSDIPDDFYGPIQKLEALNLKGVGAGEEELVITLPSSGSETMWRGTSYNIGPNDNLYVTMDVRSEQFPAILSKNPDGSYTVVEYGFFATDVGGTPI